jgi:hypothetical protein
MQTPYAYDRLRRQLFYRLRRQLSIGFAASFLSALPPAFYRLRRQLSIGFAAGCEARLCLAAPLY